MTEFTSRFQGLHDRYKRGTAAEIQRQIAALSAARETDIRGQLGSENVEVLAEIIRAAWTELSPHEKQTIIGDLAELKNLLKQREMSGKGQALQLIGNLIRESE